MIFLRLFCFLAVLLASIFFAPERMLAATAPGTTLSASTSATFQDTGGVSYTSVSNTVTTTVANAPSLTVSTPSGQNVTAGMIVLDTFTLTNTGNAAGNFNVASDATFGGTASSTTLDGYVLNGASSGTCSKATPCALTTPTTGLQAQLAALAATAVNGTITIGVEYNVSGGSGNAVVNQTIQTSFSATIAYPTTGGATSATSGSVTSTPTDTVVSDARIDMAISAPAPTTTSMPITWTITANNGGNYTASDSVAAKTLLGAGTSGVVITTQVPVFNSTALVLQSTPTCTLSGASSGATATMYYTTATGYPSGSGSWSTTYTSSAKWIACYIHGGSGGSELPSAPTSSAGAGFVSTAQATLTLVTAQPSGTGSTTLGAVTCIANAWANGAAWATGTSTVIGPGIALGTTDGSGIALNTASTEGNTTAGAGTNPPGGASNTASSQAYVAPTSSTNVGTAVYVGSDATTQGSWHAASTPWTPYAYGSDGYTILGGTSANPSYATVTLGGSYTSASWQALGTTSDARAPYGSSTTASRVAAQDYCNTACNPTTGGSASLTPFTIDVNITDGNTHQFSLYLLQWDSGAVADPILVTDVTHGTNLLFHLFSGFNGAGTPTYVRWNISGHVRFTIYWPQANGDAPTFSAYFFDPVTRSAVTSTNSASYVTTDTLTQGNWTPGSGGDGYNIPNDAIVNPSYASNWGNTWFGVLSATWASSQSDVRATYTGPGASSSSRIAGVWYAGTMGFTVPITDGNTHSFAIYFLDWDSTVRSQTVYVSDAATGAIFDARSFAGFHNGIYGVWNVKGNVVFYFIQTANGQNAVVSGVFFGNRVPSLTLVDAVTPTGNQPPGTLLTYTGTLANVGAASALNNYVTTAVPANTDFQIGSPSASLGGTGLTYAATYSNNNGISYVYTPVSGGGGAASGYDRTVTNVKWTFTGTLLQGAGNNTVSVSMIVRIQ